MKNRKLTQQESGFGSSGEEKDQTDGHENLIGSSSAAEQTNRPSIEPENHTAKRENCSQEPTNENKPDRTPQKANTSLPELNRKRLEGLIRYWNSPCSVTNRPNERGLDDRPNERELIDRPNETNPEASKDKESKRVKERKRDEKMSINKDIRLQLPSDPSKISRELERFEAICSIGQVKDAVKVAKLYAALQNSVHYARCEEKIGPAELTD